MTTISTSRTTGIIVVRLLLTGQPHSNTGRRLKCTAVRTSIHWVSWSHSLVSAYQTCLPPLISTTLLAYTRGAPLPVGAAPEARPLLVSVAGRTPFRWVSTVCALDTHAITRLRCWPSSAFQGSVQEAAPLRDVAQAVAVVQGDGHPPTEIGGAAEAQPPLPRQAPLPEVGDGDVGGSTAEPNLN